MILIVAKAKRRKQMRTQEVLQKAADLFFTVDVKEALGQAVVISDCTDYDGSKKTIGVVQVTGRLEDAVNTAMALAASKFMGVSLEREVEPEAKEVTNVKPVLTSDSKPVETKETKEDIPHPLISDEGTDDEPIGFDGSDAETFEEAVSKAAPKDITFGAPADETPKETMDADDFMVDFGRHKNRPAKASAICEKILAGDKLEIGFFEMIMNSCKMAMPGNAIAMKMKKFISYAEKHGIKTR